MTITLLTDSNGNKMGKTAGNAVWLDPNKTSPYEFYQYWRNVADEDVLKCIRMLTFLPIEEIQKMESWEGSQLNRAKEILAYELTKLVHGEEEAEKAQESAKALFGGGGDGGAPVSELVIDGDGADILTILTQSGLCSSKGDARRNIQQGGVTVNDRKITDPSAFFSLSELSGDGIMVRRGKKNYRRVIVKR